MGEYDKRLARKMARDSKGVKPVVSVPVTPEKSEVVVEKPVILPQNRPRVVVRKSNE